MIRAWLTALAVGALTGRVVDPQGRAVANADVVGSNRWHVLSALDGSFTLPDGTSLVVARSEGVLGLATVPDAGAPWVVTLTSPVMVQGEVAGNDGRSQSVFATPLDPPFSSLSTFEFEAASDGGFSVPLSPGRWSLVSRFDREPTVLEVAPGRAARVRLGHFAGRDSMRQVLTPNSR